MVIEKGKNKKSMAYVGNIVDFIKATLESTQKGYHIFNYADKLDFSMTELTLSAIRAGRLPASRSCIMFCTSRPCCPLHCPRG